jgi:hypothetical protein
MMSYEDSTVARALLIEVIKEIATGDTTRRDRLLEVGGALFDANYLDGQQYALVHELHEHPTDRAVIERCLAAV